jgi:hypothetical protein
LDEQPNQGRTIFQKFQDHSDVAFAIVLLTGDDIGGEKGTSPEGLSPRASVPKSGKKTAREESHGPHNETDAEKAGGSVAESSESTGETSK